MANCLVRSPFVISSVADPDPDQHSFWLAAPHWEYGSGSRRAKRTHKSEENSSFEELDVLI